MSDITKTSIIKAFNDNNIEAEKIAMVLVIHYQIINDISLGLLKHIRKTIQYCLLLNI